MIKKQQQKHQSLIYASYMANAYALNVYWIKEALFVLVSGYVC